MPVDGFKPVEHRVLFVGSFSQEYDVASDGRFVMISDRISETAPQAMVLVQNWFEELRQKAPRR